MTKHIVNDALIKNVYEAVDKIKFGTVLIKVHDRKITQIEVTEKQRLDEVWNLEKGEGI